MIRPATTAAVLLLVVAGMAVPAGGVATAAAGPDVRTGENGTAPSNGSAAEAAPGAVFAGAVEVQEAAIGDELAGRDFEVRIARAESPAGRAAVVAERLDELTRRTAALREDERALEAARANGSLSESRFHAGTAAIGARSVAVGRRLDQVEATSRALPPAVLEANGVTASAIETLRSEVDAVATPDVVEVARSIGGADVGAGLAGGSASPSTGSTISTALPPPTATGTSGRPAGDDTTSATLPGTPHGSTDVGNGSRTADEPR